MTAAPKIDGKIDPEEWATAFHAEDLRDRVTGQPPADRTEVWAGYDDRNLYFAFRCHDAKPSGIVGREITPNASFSGEDTVSVAINTLGNRTFNSNSSFTTNVLGTKAEQIAGGRAEKREWRGDWTCATSRDAEGWSAEMAIPWTMLNTPRRSKMSMGLNFYRFQFRTRIESSWANATQNALPENEGYWEDIEPPAPPRARPQFLAYVAPEFDSGKIGARQGLDVRYPITPTLYGLASLAPDFRNIENFVAGVGFTRVERYVGDARPFFNEGGDYFNLNRNYTYGDLLYTRRVGEFDLGGKVYGQLTPNSTLGAFAAIKFGGQRAAVVNYNRVFSSTASANVYATVNQDEPTGNDARGGGGQNLAVGGTVQRRYGNLTFAGAFTGETDNGIGGDLAAAVVTEYAAPRVFTTLKYYTVAPGFSPALGYIPWTDRQGYNSYTEVYKEIRRGAIRSVYANFDLSRLLTYGGDIQQSGYSTFLNVATRTDIGLGIGKERYTYFGALDDVTSYSVGLNQSNRYRRINLDYEDGVRNDRPSRFTSINGSYRIGQRLDLGASQSIQEYDGTTSLSILTAGYQLSPTRSLVGRAVIRKGETNLYAAYRSAGGRGTDVYLILGDPNATSTVARVSLKLVRAF